MPTGCNPASRAVTSRSVAFFFRCRISCPVAFAVVVGDCYADVDRLLAQESHLADLRIRVEGELAYAVGVGMLEELRS